MFRISIAELLALPVNDLVFQIQKLLDVPAKTGKQRIQKIADLQTLRSRLKSRLALVDRSDPKEYSPGDRVVAIHRKLLLNNTGPIYGTVKRTDEKFVLVVCSSTGQEYLFSPQFVRHDIKPEILNETNISMSDRTGGKAKFTASFTVDLNTYE